MPNEMTIKKLAPDDQPREKLQLKGTEALSNAELLAILIGSGTKEKSAVRLCQDILSSVNNDLNMLAKLSFKDLMKFKGIGEAKAISITAALEVGRRRPSEKFELIDTIKSSKHVYMLMRPYFADKEHEEFYCISLSRANKVKAVDLVSKGGISGTVADGKIIFKRALQNSASAVILCHNHPSGNLEPSSSDINLTNRLKEFGKMIDMPVLDHLIITNDSYVSFADKGLI